MKDPPFEIGDTVRLKRGWTEMTVRAVDYFKSRDKITKQVVEGWFIRAQYRKSERWHDTREDGWEHWRLASHHVMWDGDPREGEDEMSTEEESNKVQVGDLFQVKGEDTFGTYMATNSKGQYVLEIKGGDGKPAAYDIDKVEEVVPYTILVRKITSDSNTRAVIHWQVPVGAVEKGDMLYNSDGTRFVVKDVDTKSKKTQSPPRGLRKFVTTEVKI